MDNIEDDYLTNLSWLEVSNSNESQSTVECSNNHIDEDLQCLCWVMKMRPTTYASHSLKRLSVSTNRDNYYRSLPTTYAFDRSLNAVTNAIIDTGNANDNSTSRRILMLRTLNHHLSPTKSFQQSCILIRSSNGKISCLSIRHFV